MEMAHEQPDITLVNQIVDREVSFSSTSLSYILVFTHSNPICYKVTSNKVEACD